MTQTQSTHLKKWIWLKTALYTEFQQWVCLSMHNAAINVASSLTCVNTDTMAKKKAILSVLDEIKEEIDDGNWLNQVLALLS